MDHLPALPSKPQPNATTSSPTDIPPSISPRSGSSTRPTRSGLKHALAYAHLSVMNNFPDVQELERYLDELNLTDGERLRPGWDTYFMVRPPPTSFQIPLTPHPRW